MSLKNKFPRITFLLATLAIFALVLNTNVSALEFDDYDVTLDTSGIDAGEDFEVKIFLEDADEDYNDNEILIEIRFDGVLVHREDDYKIDVDEGDNWSDTFKSNYFEVDGDKIWESNLMNYECVNNAEVEVYIDTNDWDDTQSDDIDIEKDRSENEFYYEMDPSQWVVDDNFNITVFDDHDGEVDDAYVRLTWIEEGDEDGVWDISDFDDYMAEHKTNKGDVDFDDLEDEIDENDPYGKWQLDIYKDGFCKRTETISIVNLLNVSDPDPAEPIAGQSFKVKIVKPDGTPATGLAAFMSPGNIRAIVSSSGYATFTVPSDGTYSIAVGGGDTGFEEIIKSVKVTKQDKLSPTASPDPANIKKDVTITVKAGGTSIQGATVYVQRQGGTEQKLMGTTSSDGRITYIPEQPGDYTIKAEKTGYESGTDTFQVKNSFNVEMPSSGGVKRGETASIVVKDQSGSPVSEAQVMVEGTTVSGLTDAAGRFSFTLPNTGAFTLLVKKQYFTDFRKQLSSSGELTMKLSHMEMTLGEELKVSVVNREGTLTRANLKFEGPSGIHTGSGSEYKYTPTKVGYHTVTASETGYASSTANYTVKPMPLDFTYDFNDGILYINATSNGKPVKNLKITVTTSSGTQDAFTNDVGVAQLVTNATGNYTITVNDENYVKKEISAVMEKGMFDSGLLFPIALIVVALGIILVFIIVVVALVHFKKSKPKQSNFDRYQRNRLRD